MKLATLRDAATTMTVLVTTDAAIQIVGFPDVGALLTRAEWRSIAAAADGIAHPLVSIEPTRWAPVIPAPGKIVCAGLNYRNHILEMGRILPDVPTFFAKYSDALVGAFDDIELPPVSDAVDWEGELAVVIGAPARNVSESEAEKVITGYAVLNDVSMRDFQYRTLQWLQGKTFENSTPFGPYLVTTDEWTPGPTMRTVVDGETVQEASTGDLMFTPTALIFSPPLLRRAKPVDAVVKFSP